MKEKSLPLNRIKQGEEVILTDIKAGRGLRARLYDMGLKEGIHLKVLHSHSRGPCIVLAGNTRLVLGRGASHKIFVRRKSN